jgi:hypothetical protein
MLFAGPRETYRWLRRRLRVEIERALLDGRTLDEVGEELLPEGGEVADLERKIDLDLLALRDILATLSDEDRHILLASNLSTRDRKRKERLSRKITKIFAR